MSIVRQGLAEDKKFADCYEAIFGKKTAKKTPAKTAPAKKKPAAKKK